MGLAAPGEQEQASCPRKARPSSGFEGYTGLTDVRLWGPWGLCPFVGQGWPSNPHAKQLPPTAERVVVCVIPGIHRDFHRVGLR